MLWLIRSLTNCNYSHSAMAFALLRPSVATVAAPGELDMLRLCCDYRPCRRFSRSSHRSLSQMVCTAVQGTKTTITAWNESYTTALEHRFCVGTRTPQDYVTSGDRRHDEAKRHVCAERGPGSYR